MFTGPSMQPTGKNVQTNAILAEIVQKLNRKIVQNLNTKDRQKLRSLCTIFRSSL